MAEQDKSKGRPRLVGRPAAGKPPAAQASAPAAAPQAAPAEDAAVSAQEPVAKRGPAALPARKPPGERVVRVPAPEAKSGKLVKMVLLLIVFGGIPLLVVAGFVVRKNDNPLWYHLLNQMGMMKLEKAKPSKAAETASALDKKYTAAIIARGRAERYVNQEVGDARLQFATLDGARADEIAKKLSGFLEEITAGIEDIKAVVEEPGKPAGAAVSKVDPVTAGRELSSQTQFSKDLLALSTEWKGIADVKSGRVVVAAAVKRTGPRKSVVEERKPDPDAPQEPEKPKPEPVKPAEPEKPKPAEPAKPAEPEKPKPEPAKPEPEKPKPEPAKPVEPEKPKPAEPEKPKPEPAKPEPAKPEPEKPKPEPAKPAEPEKPKVPVKTPEQLVAEADKLIAEGQPLALEVIKGSRPLPEDADKRKDLGIQCETAMAFFSKAKGILEGLKDAVPVADKLAKVEKVLGLLQNVQDGLKSKQ